MLKKHAFLITNIIIIILIVTGFIIIQMNDIAFYRQVVQEQAQNNVTLSGIDISSQLTNITTEQRVASQMMANDIFLKQWCESEQNDPNSDHARILYRYLKEYQIKYNYDIVFFVSNKTLNYYYNDGLNKVISPDSDIDIWYYNFLHLDREYDIQIDRDEVNDYNVSIFVNCRVLDDHGNLIGVVGAGKKMDDFHSILTAYEASLNVKVFIVNIGNAHNSFRESTRYYKTLEDASRELGVPGDAIANSDWDSQYNWIQGNLCMNIQHNNDLNWNVIVQKDIQPTMSNILQRMNKRVLFLVIVIFTYIVISLTLLYRMNKLTHHSHNTDELTGLMNNRLFRERYNKEYKRYKHKDGALFMLDVDNFKQINDTLGHLYGNAVLKLVSDDLMHTIGDNGFVGRWGGDEFIGVLFMPAEQGQDMLNALLNEIKDRNTQLPITFSCGITDLIGELPLNDAIKCADQALYKAKENGKGQCISYKSGE